MSSQQRIITVGVDGSDGGRRALAWAIRHAATTGAAVDVVTAWSWDGMAFAPGNLGGPDDEQQFATEMQKRDLDRVLSEFAGPEPQITSRIVEGNPTKALVEAARSADLLVVGSHGRGYLATALLGSVSESCVRRGTTPVVIVPVHNRTVAAA
jgi:nucleotide-binding universal stress UspA family protein